MAGTVKMFAGNEHPSEFSVGVEENQASLVRPELPTYQGSAHYRYLQTDLEHEKGRVTASDGQGLLPGMSANGQSPELQINAAKSNQPRANR